MSGLSLADMRRIGAQKNAESATQPKKLGGVAQLMKRLPFGAGPKDADSGQSSGQSRGQSSSFSVADRASASMAVPGVFGHQPSTQAAAAVSAPAVPTPTPPKTPMPTYERVSAPVSDVDEVSLAGVLRQNTLKHAGLGGAVGGLVGFGATGNPLVLPAGLAVGAAAGAVVAKRGSALASDKSVTLELKRKQAEPLFEALEAACALVRQDKPALRVIIDRSARIKVQAKPGAKLSSSKSYIFVIGLPVLVGLSLEQIEALAAHALVEAQGALETSSVSAQMVARLDQLQTNLAKRPAALRLNRLADLQQQGQSATRAWQNASQANLLEADRMTARYAGPRALVQAILAQALLAACFTAHQREELPLGEALEQLRQGYPRPVLDEALRALAQVHYPSPTQAMMGLPVALLERLKNLDMSCPPPALPAAQPAVTQLPEKTLRLLDKRLVGRPAKAPKAQKAKKIKAEKPAKPPKAAKQSKSFLLGKRAQSGAAVDRLDSLTTSKPEKAKRSLFAGLAKPKTNASAADFSMELHKQPLYQADELYKSDPGTGLEAYQALVDAHPRWMLARLRLAEAQIECGIADSVEHLMICSEHLPSALPAVLDRLQSALAMVSPLDGERLRQTIDQLLANADQIADERAQIDLASLVPATLDGEDARTLADLFAKTPGLREVWVQAMPCTFMPEVPHHAVIGLAPRVSADHAQAMARSIAEHAAVIGTVAVHIEAATPRGALGDALATHASVWRAENH